MINFQETLHALIHRVLGGSSQSIPEEVERMLEMQLPKAAEKKKREWESMRDTEWNVAHLYAALRCQQRYVGSGAGSAASTSGRRRRRSRRRRWFVGHEHQ